MGRYILGSNTAMNNNYQNLKQKLESRNQSLKKQLVDKHKEAFEWAQNNTKQIAAGAVGSLLLLVSPATNFLPKPDEMAVHATKLANIPQNVFVINDLAPYIPENVAPLIGSQEEKIAQIISGYYGFEVKPEINGMRLNTTYGYIGLEQHLKRYPGDTMEDRMQQDPKAVKFAKNGIAAGRGGFGYFAKSKAEMTKKDADREKYYIAVQTFLAPGFMERKKEYIDFFKFRKMLLVNPENGKAVVAVIGDAGPAVWTGKQLGGSPEVMDHLERVDGKSKGAVLYFFINDPEDKIPLGPVEPVAIDKIQQI